MKDEKVDVDFTKTSKQKHTMRVGLSISRQTTQQPAAVEVLTVWTEALSADRLSKFEKRQLQTLNNDDSTGDKYIQLWSAKNVFTELHIREDFSKFLIKL